MPLYALVILTWLALQMPVGIAVGRLLSRRQPHAAAPTSSFPAAPEEGTHA